jgi:hypothetical protein
MNGDPRLGAVFLIGGGLIHVNSLLLPTNSLFRRLKFPVFELTGNFIQRIEIKWRKRQIQQNNRKFLVIFPVLREFDARRRRMGIG